MAVENLTPGNKGKSKDGSGSAGSANNPTKVRKIRGKLNSNTQYRFKVQTNVLGDKLKMDDGVNNFGIALSNIH